MRILVRTMSPGSNWPSDRREDIFHHRALVAEQETSAVMPVPIGSGRPLRSRARSWWSGPGPCKALAGLLVEHRVGRDGDDAVEAAIDRAVIGGDVDLGLLADADEGDVLRRDHRLDQQALLGRHDLDQRRARADGGADGGDEDAVDPARQRRAHHGALARSASAGRVERRAESRPGRWRARWRRASASPGAAGPGRRAPRRPPARARETVAAAAAASLAATAAALSAWISDRRGSMPRSTSGRMSRASCWRASRAETRAW
jgi:hypothetical protein